jgi:hypothetical protein
MAAAFTGIPYSSSSLTIQRSMAFPVCTIRMPPAPVGSKLIRVRVPWGTGLRSAIGGPHEAKNPIQRALRSR